METGLGGHKDGSPLSNNAACPWGNTYACHLEDGLMHVCVSTTLACWFYRRVDTGVRTGERAEEAGLSEGVDQSGFSTGTQMIGCISMY